MKNLEKFYFRSEILALMDMKIKSVGSGELPVFPHDSQIIITKDATIY